MSGLISWLIIQGGMGFNISDWFLARTLSLLGQLGTVSGTALEIVMAEALQRGDVGGHFRRALAHFPFPQFSKMVLDEYYVEGGIKDGARLKRVEHFSVEPSVLLTALNICANFASVWLAKEGHKNPVSINYLEKISMPLLSSIFGAMLAEVDFITVGAGILPNQIPEVISRFSRGEEAEYIVPVVGINLKKWTMRFNPRSFFGSDLDKVLLLKKPGFIPIISSNLLAGILTKRLPKDSIFGFVVEESTAGGHNAPPRRSGVYGGEDQVDYVKLAGLGLPFWIGGSYASPEKLAWARSVGAVGIQAGGIFALSEDSGMNPTIRQTARRLGWLGKLKVRTDSRISTSGFPFKVALIDGTISEERVYNDRQRVCRYGVLVTLYEKPDGTIGYRCPGEPVETYVVRKGGKIEDTVGRGCLCCGLCRTGNRGPDTEPAIVTVDDDVSFLLKLMPTPDSSYKASDAVDYILGKA